MIKTLPAALLLLLISCAATPEKDKFTGVLLWKISGNGVKSPSYILGTHHLASVEFLDNIAGYKKVMSETQQIYGELKTADMGEMQMKLMQEAIMPDSVTYQSLLSEDDYNKLDEGLKSLLGMGLSSLGKFKPGMISSMYSMALFAKIVPGFNSFTHEAIDIHIQKVATEQGKECFGLETVEDQISALFDAEPLQIQAGRLACAVSNVAYNTETLRQLNEFYFKGDLHTMYNLTLNNSDDPCPSSEIFNSALNNNRNDKWLMKIPTIMAEKSTFFVVGALHLAGKEGLLMNLDKMGYTVERMK